VTGAEPPSAGSPAAGQAKPDPRVSYANERTLLAWIRTALGLMTAGLAITQVLPAFRVAGGRRSIGLPLIALGTLTAAAAYHQWAANERAIRAGTPIPRSLLAAAVTGVVVVVTTLALVLAAISSPPT
jgi:putative membrane protein